MINDLLSLLPYKSSFRFVDHITHIDSNGVTGDYTLDQNAFFYKDHFVGNPITPGAIIIEIMAQIGLVVLGIYLLTAEGRDPGVALDNGSFPLLTSTNVTFYKMVLPGEKVVVQSTKEYFRFGKLKCIAEMRNLSGDLIAKGTFAGMVADPALKLKE